MLQIRSIPPPPPPPPQPRAAAMCYIETEVACNRLQCFLSPRQFRIIQGTWCPMNYSHSIHAAISCPWLVEVKVFKQPLRSCQFCRRAHDEAFVAYVRRAEEELADLMTYIHQWPQ
ncbi:hypothetical protein DOTSEDRAFT_22880 [Dothistroma septosporum NZE10]|uniref:Uncharacterized protein n=1 Tax=Dothistroma septosporum (strain NZE10 / CBS 128990) TaxID=675120 RepID=N1PU06_DOTSN|nr:hypothetical protein DOTSEDRAFT_22880 [Dothistroma septosporum NZE10]